MENLNLPPGPPFVGRPAGWLPRVLLQFFSLFSETTTITMTISCLSFPPLDSFDLQLFEGSRKFTSSHIKFTHRFPPACLPARLILTRISSFSPFDLLSVCSPLANCITRHCPARPCASRSSFGPTSIVQLFARLFLQTNRISVLSRATLCSYCN